MVECNSCGKSLFDYNRVGVEDGEIFCESCSKLKGIDLGKSLRQTVCSGCNILVIEPTKENIDAINSRVFCSEKCRTNFSETKNHCISCGKEI